MQRVNYQISLYPLHKNRKIERRVRKNIRRSVEMFSKSKKKAKDGRNKMRAMSKRLN